VNPLEGSGEVVGMPLRLRAGGTGQLEDPPKVTVHDVTLRTGNRRRAWSFGKIELKIAHALEEIGIHRIEGGMIATSQEDFEAIAAMAKKSRTRKWPALPGPSG